ncbi:ras-related protein Rab-8A-like isoform X2 [Corticium candelabrum]|nr:ras-related protein Rab-8A-like isoform X2 [Corticium candelabrum]
MLVYDITTVKSFDNISEWIRDVDEHAAADVLRMILGNKCDMTDERKVSRKEGETLAAEHGIKFMETSAKTGQGVEEAFYTLVRDIKAKMDQILDPLMSRGGSLGGVTVTAQRPTDRPQLLCCTLI